jgi:hypothetical protein
MKLALAILLSIVVGVIGFVGGCIVGVSIAANNQQFSLRLEASPHGIGVSGRLPASLTTRTQLPWSGTLPPSPRVAPSETPAPSVPAGFGAVSDTDTGPCGYHWRPCGIGEVPDDGQ